MSVGIVWFRQDLRVTDNPALSAAVAACDTVVCLFIDDPTDQTVSRVGAASRVWLHHSLLSLQQTLQQRGADLVIASGDSETMLAQVSAAYQATHLFWNRCYDPVSIKRDKKIKQSLSALQPESFNALLNAEPWESLKGDETAYRVFTPFWRMRAKSLPGPKPIRAPRAICGAHIASSAATRAGKFSPTSIAALALLPAQDWHVNMMAHWQVGEKAAMTSLKRFLKAAVHDYTDARNLPSLSGAFALWRNQSSSNYACIELRR